MSNKKKEIVNQFTRGLNWSTQPDVTPNDSWEYAFNAVVSDNDGAEAGLISEYSNYACVTLPLGYKTIGRVSTFKDNIKKDVIALTNDVNSIIAEITPGTCTYVELVSNTCLGFNTKYPLNMLVKIKNNRDRIIYFTDDLGDYRSINIDNLADYEINNAFTCNKIKFSPDVKIPTIQLKSIASGGQVKLGSYRAYVKYVNSDLSETNIVGESESFQISKPGFDDRYFSVDGGYNVNATGISTAEQYNVSNRSVQFKLNNLSANFKYCYIEIVGKVGGTGAIDFAQRSPLLPISVIPNTTNANPITWTFTGSNGSSTSVGAIIEDKVVLHKVKAQAQKENRLYVGNTTEELYIPYYKIQQAALLLHPRWTATAVDKFEKINGNSKNTLSYSSMMRDEVYAIGIKGKTLDGKSTPVFHIPGRAQVDVPAGQQFQNFIYRTHILDNTGQWDSRLLSITTNTTTQTNTTVNQYEVDHLQGYIVGNQIPQWRVFNTAWIDTIAGSRYAGEMGYYESDVSYPSISTPNGELYGALVGTPIRHHKMPDTNTLIHVDNQAVYPLYVQVDLTPFLAALTPDVTDNILEWEIVFAQRTEENKTVLDKGFTTWDETKRGSNSNYVNGLQVDPKVCRFYGPKMLFEKANLTPTHYKVEQFNSFKTVLGNPNAAYDRQVPGASSSVARDHIREFYDTTGQFNLDIVNFKRLTNFKVDYTSYIADTTLDKTKQTWVQGLLPTVISQEAQRNYNYTPHSWNFITQQGAFINNPENRAPNDAATKGFITYGSLKNEHSVYENLSELIYFKFNNQKLDLINFPNTITVTEGDTFIGPLTLAISSFVDYVNTYDGFRPVSGTLYDVVHDVYYRWVESEINVGMRHQKNVNNNQNGDLYYQGWIGFNGTAPIFQSVKGLPITTGYEEHLQEMAGIKTILQSNQVDRLFKQALLFNPDYKYISSVKPHVSLSQNYNYFTSANSIRNLYKIRYSEKSFQDTTLDNYKTFLENNATTQDAQQGEIRDLFVDKNELYSRTPKTILFIPTNTQTIKTNESTFYLGTASVLPYEPKAINTLSHSYGGGYDFTHKLVTEFGTVLIDIYSNKVFLLRDGLQDLTQNMNPFFTKFMKWDLVDYNADSMDNSISVYYDTAKKRLLITNHRYIINNVIKPILDSGVRMTYNPAGNNFSFFDQNNPAAAIPNRTLAQVANLEEYTISYSFKRNEWISWHTYIPTIGWETDKGFLTNTSTNTENIIYKHELIESSATKYLNFNSAQHPFIVEFTVNDVPSMSKILNRLNIQSDHIEWNSIDCYTENQHTGHQFLTVIPQGTNPVLTDYYTANITGFEEYFRIDRLVDRIIDTSLPVWTINDRLTKVPNVANINLLQTMYQNALRGKWIRVRLEYRTTTANNKRQSIWAVLSLVDMINR